MANPASELVRRQSVLLSPTTTKDTVDKTPHLTCNCARTTHFFSRATCAGLKTASTVICFFWVRSKVPSRPCPCSTIHLRLPRTSRFILLSVHTHFLIILTKVHCAVHVSGVSLATWLNQSTDGASVQRIRVSYDARWGLTEQNTLRKEAATPRLSNAGKTKRHLPKWKESTANEVPQISTTVIVSRAQVCNAGEAVMISGESKL